MPIGFDGQVEVTGVWLGKGSGQGSEADAVRLLGQAGGKTIATGAWTDLEEQMVFVALNAKGIDRLVIEARKADWTQAWYSLDDLTYVRAGRTVVLDFEDVPPGNLTGTGYGGLVWQRGEALKAHSPGPVSLLTRPQPQPLAPLVAPKPASPSPAAPTSSSYPSPAASSSPPPHRRQR